MGFESVKPLISGYRPAWISSIAIKGDSSAFQLLPPVSEVSRANSFIKDEDLPPRELLEEYMRRDVAPIPATADREGYHGDRHFDWWFAGLKDYLGIKSALTRYSSDLEPGEAVFDLGCASGRTLRHFAAQEPLVQPWGADINLRHVEWCRNYLPRSSRVFQNTVLPHLPLEDSYFKAVCAFSVFTHIDDFDTAWLAELRRILKPGGLAYLTVHTEHTWTRMQRGENLPVKQALEGMRRHIADYEVCESLFANPLPAPKTVFWWDTASNYNSDVFLTTDYIRETWGRFFQVVDIIVSGHSYQDVVLLRKV